VGDPYELIIAGVLAVLCIAASIARSKWLTVMCATLMFGAQLILVVISFDSGLRTVSYQIHEKTGQRDQLVIDTLTMVRGEYLPTRGALLLLAVGFLILALRDSSETKSE
jgi:hypothetical protein